MKKIIFLICMSLLVFSFVPMQSVAGLTFVYWTNTGNGYVFVSQSGCDATMIADRTTNVAYLFSSCGDMRRGTVEEILPDASDWPADAMRSMIVNNYFFTRLMDEHSKKQGK